MFVWRPRQGHLGVGGTGAEPRSTQVHNGLPRAPGGSDVKRDRPASLATFPLSPCWAPAMRRSSTLQGRQIKPRARGHKLLPSSWHL